MAKIKFIMKSKILFIALLSILISCKTDKKETEDAVTVETEKNVDLFKVSFDLVIKKDDNLHLYYTQDGSIVFNEKNSVWLPVTGKESVQKVTFNLPKDVLPTHIRVDFGIGKNAQSTRRELRPPRPKRRGPKRAAR